MNALFDTFENRESEGIYMGGPTHACMDPTADFSSGNVHPLDSGHAKIGAIQAGNVMRTAA
ncbi:MAG: hypothetical protein JNG85_16390 [Spirochaetaceae bacterium]|nr:hypothetical protein [Spirochaetaceae bacterium]